MDIVPDFTSFGSLFEFTQIGQDEFINEFQSAVQKISDPPTITYDSSNHVFVCAIENDLVLNLFAKHMTDFISRHTSLLTDPMSVPRVVPIINTAISREDGVQTNHRDLFTSRNETLLIDLDDDDSDDTSDNTSSTECVVVYWVPKNRDVHILTQNVAARLATLTDSYLGFESNAGRVRLANGSVHTALEKIQNLEPLLECIAYHQKRAGCLLDGNILSLSSHSPQSGLCFVPIALCQNSAFAPVSASGRILTDISLQDSLKNLQVGEERSWNHESGAYVKPANLDYKDVQPTGDCPQPSKIWSNYPIKEFGDSRNKSPQISSAVDAMGLSGRQSILPVRTNNQISRYLGSQDQTRLQDWSASIDAQADPTIAATAPIEPEVETVAEVEDEEQPATTRLVAPDSDEEDEDLHSRPGQGKRPLIDHPVDNKAWPEIQREQSYRLNKTRGPDPPFSSNSQNRPTRPARGLDLLDDFSTTHVSNIIPELDTALSTLTREEENKEPTDRDVSVYTSQDPEVLSLPQRTHESLDDSSNVEAVARTESVIDSLGTESRTGQRAMRPATTLNKLVGTVGSLEPRADSAESYTNMNKAGNDPTDNWQEQKTRKQRFQKRPQSTYNSHSDTVVARPAPIPAWPRPHEIAGPDRVGPRHNSRPARRLEELIELNEGSDTNRRMKTPPGLNIKPSEMISRSNASNLLDSPLDEIQKPSLKPYCENPLYTSDDHSISASTSSGGYPAQFDYVPLAKVSRNSTANLRDDTIARLLREKQQDRDVSQVVHGTSARTETMCTDNELTSRKFYNTMNLRASNPGSSGRKSKAKGRGNAQDTGKQETAAQRRARIDQALADSHGSIASRSSKAENSASKADVSGRSKRVQNLARSNPAMAAIHSHDIQDIPFQDQADQLCRIVKPTFELVRSFTGKLTFELQFGQIMIMPSDVIRMKTVYDKKRWSERFQKPNSTIQSVFTDLLTSNGADMDRLLQTRSGSGKLWHDSHSGDVETILDFHCQTPEHEFKVLLDLDKGVHNLRLLPSTISKIGIQCPGRIWDACAVLHGTSRWDDIPNDVEAIVKSFVDTLYVKGGDRVIVFYRPPLNKGLSVHSVNLRRVSFYDCLQQENVQLRVTEVKLLSTQIHARDKNLYRSEESSHDIMHEQARIHYQAALMHKTINAEFQANEDIELGEFTANTPVLSSQPARELMKVALQQVAKMDFVGMFNYGTLIRVNDDRLTQEEENMSRLPPTIAASTLKRPLHTLPSGMSVAGPRSMLATGRNMSAQSVAPLPVPGIWSGTEAPIFQDGQGRFVKIGLNGARVPLAVDEDKNTSSRLLTPNDSASQAGGFRRQPAQSSLYGNDTDEGFW